MRELCDQIDWDKGDGLVPAIVQDAVTARVLMLGYMNRDALAKTIESGNVTFFSRSKQRLWTKGETSGNVLTLANIKADCDNDTLLVKANPAGPVCHKGTETCFGEGHDPDTGFLGTLETIIAGRRDADPDSSYVASLLQKGVAKMAQKVGEEGVETALAATTDDGTLKDEAADLVFHLLVLLQAQGLSLRDIADVLEKRHR